MINDDASAGQAMDPKRRRVLFAAIVEYISSGSPVSSKSLSAKPSMGMSPATIRRVFADLTRGGWLVQPHTSAGRIPTDRAFRLFVDALRASATEVDAAVRERLLDGLRDLAPGDTSSWRDTLRVLSDLAAQAALVITPAVSDAVIRQLRFVPLGGRELLAVVVTVEGIISNVHLESDEPMDDRDLERVHNYLGGLASGRTLNELRSVLREELEDARRRCDLLRERATRLGERAIDASVERTSELMVEGHSHLIARPELRDQIQELMAALEEKAVILRLLDRAARQDDGPLVIIGQEGGEMFDGCALVAAPFGVDGSPSGRIGVLGSARMDYQAILPLVGLSARLLSGSLGRKGR